MKGISQVGRIKWEPLAILSTFELIPSCILTLLHLIEQSHIAGHYASFALPLSRTSNHILATFKATIRSATLSLSLPLFLSISIAVRKFLFYKHLVCIHCFLVGRKFVEKVLASEILWRKPHPNCNLADRKI